MAGKCKRCQGQAQPKHSPPPKRKRKRSQGQAQPSASAAQAQAAQAQAQAQPGSSAATHLPGQHQGSQSLSQFSSVSSVSGRNSCTMPHTKAMFQFSHIHGYAYPRICVNEVR